MKEKMPSKAQKSKISFLVKRATQAEAFASACFFQLATNDKSLRVDF